MSMPTIEISPIDVPNAINNIVASIALAEAGIAHILNAEGEKIEKALELAQDDPNITPEQIAELNQSVADVVKAVGALEAALADKLDAVLEHQNPRQPEEEA